MTATFACMLIAAIIFFVLVERPGVRPVAPAPVEPPAPPTFDPTALQRIPTIRDFDDEEPTRRIPPRTLDEVGRSWRDEQRRAP